MLIPNEVAEMLHVRPSTTVYWRKKGILPAYKLSSQTYRFDPRDVKSFAENLNSKLTANEVA